MSDITFYPKEEALTWHLRRTKAIQLKTKVFINSTYQLCKSVLQDTASGIINWHDLTLEKIHHFTWTEECDCNILLAVKHSFACYSHVWTWENGKERRKIAKTSYYDSELRGTHRIIFFFTLKMQSELMFIPLLCLLNFSERD